MPIVVETLHGDEQVAGRNPARVVGDPRHVDVAVAVQDCSSPSSQVSEPHRV
jgi:hypothetical protein